MRRPLIQGLFVVLGLAWLGYTALDWIGAALGDCGDDQWCLGHRSISSQLVFWRGLCVGLLLVLAYRVVRVEAEE